MDLTTATLQELRQRKAEMDQLILNGQAIDGDEYNMVSNRIAELVANDPEAELEEEDPVITKAKEEIALFETPLGAYITNEVIHTAVRNIVLPVVYRLMEELESIRTEKESNETSANNEQAELFKQIEERDAEIIALKKEVYDLQLIADDRVTKIDNAYNELQEAKETIEQLNQKLTAATTIKPKPRTNAEGADVVEVKPKRAIYAVVLKGKWNEKFDAKYADTDESFEDYTIFKDNKYTEVQAEEANTFRAEYLATQEPVEADISGIVEMESEAVIPFRDDTEEETASGQLGLVTETPTVVGSTVTRQEFEELKAEFYDVKARFFGNY